MGNSGKIITIVIIVIVGIFILALIQKAGSGGMGFFGLFGVAVFFIIKSVFKKDNEVNVLDMKNNSLYNSKNNEIHKSVNNIYSKSQINTNEKDENGEEIQEFTNDQTLSMNLFHIAVSNISKLEINFSQWLSDDGHIEALIFNTYFILTIIKNTNYKMYKEIESNYFYFLIRYSINYGTKLKIDEIGKFINSRLFFYDSEMKKISESQGYMGGKIYSILYLKPLSNKIEDSFDLEKNIKLLLVIGLTSENIKNEVLATLKNSL